MTHAFEGTISYSKADLGNKWWRDPDSNRGHMDFQSTALPTELSRQITKARIV